MTSGNVRPGPDRILAVPGETFRDDLETRENQTVEGSLTVRGRGGQG